MFVLFLYFFLCCTPRELTFLTFWLHQFKFSYYLCGQRVETEAGSAEEQPARDRLSALSRKGLRSPSLVAFFTDIALCLRKPISVKELAQHTSISGRDATNTCFGGSAIFRTLF